MSGQKLTVKQKKFADEYIKTGNATKSALEAGYSKKTAYSVGNENLKKPEIKKYIESQMQKLEDSKIMGAKEAIEIISAIARGESKTKQMVKYQDQTWLVDVPPSYNDMLNASKEILKRYPLNALDKAQIKKAQAEAVRAEAEAKLAKAQAEQLHTVADKTREKMDKLSTEELRNLAKLAGEGDD